MCGHASTGREARRQVVENMTNRSAGWRGESVVGCSERYRRWQRERNMEENLSGVGSETRGVARSMKRKSCVNEFSFLVTTSLSGMERENGTKIMKNWLQSTTSAGGDALSAKTMLQDLQRDQAIVHYCKGLLVVYACYIIKFLTENRCIITRFLYSHVRWFQKLWSNEQHTRHNAMILCDACELILKFCSCSSRDTLFEY